MASALNDQRRLSPETFRLLRDLIYDHCGIFFADDNAYIIHRRLQPRLDDLSLADFAEYYRYLISVDASARKAELEEVVDRVTTNETYFFRESYQLDAFRDEILPELYQQQAARPSADRLVRGLLVGRRGLHDRHPDHGDRALRRVGRARLRQRHLPSLLHTARKAQYGPRLVPRHRRAADAALLSRSRRQAPGARRGARAVQLRPDQPDRRLDDAIVGDVDVVFCRNVLIYFDAMSRRKVIATLHQKLARGGYLLFGHSESLINVTTAFELVHLKNDMVYRESRRMS